MIKSPAATAVTATLTELGPGTVKEIAVLADLDTGTVAAALRTLLRDGTVDITAKGDPARRISTTVYALTPAQQYGKVA